MKKIIILPLALLISAAFYYASAQHITTSRPAGDPEPITTLVVDAKVTVVLVTNSNATLQMTGDNALIEPITLTRTGDTLVISSPKKRNYRQSRIIYVPASQIRKIQVNAEAHIRTMQTLHIPRLDVVTLTDEEILDQVSKYSEFVENFDSQTANAPLLSWVVNDAESNVSLSNLDRWYTRESEEVLGKYRLIRVRPRASAEPNPPAEK